MDKLIIVSSDLSNFNQYHRGLAGAYEVYSAANIDDCLNKVKSIPIDLIIVDTDGRIDLSDGIKSLKLDSITRNMPIVVSLQNKNSELKIKLLSIGVMDVVDYPLIWDEFRALVGNRVFMSKGYRTKKLTLGMFQLDEHEFTAKYDGINIALTKREFDLLRYLLLHRYKVVSRGELIDKAWSGSQVKPRAVDTQIVRLRKKLTGTNLKILAFEGRGYVLKSNDQLLDD